MADLRVIDWTEAREEKAEVNMPQLTNRERILLKSLSKGATYAEAARAAGYSENNLRQSGFQALQRIKEKMPDVLDRKGLTDDAVIDRYLLPALSAEDTEFAKCEGKITDSQNVVAWGARLNALDLLFRLKGSYAPVKSEESKDTNVTIRVLFDEEPKKTIDVPNGAV